MVADPGFAFNCPRCPRRLAYIDTLPAKAGDERDTYVYACPEHGRWLLPPHGRFEPQPTRLH